MKYFFAGGKRVVFFLSLWDEISPAGQYFPDRAYHARHMLDAVYDRIGFLTENKIAVFAHQFDDQYFGTEISQIVQMFDADTDDSFQPGLADA